MASGDRAWLYFLVGGLVLIGVYLLAESYLARSLIYDGIGIAAGITILIAQRRRRPAARGGWRLIGIGVLLFAAGDITWTYVELVLNSYPQGSIADVLYIAGYAALALGILMLVRSRTAGKGRDATIDALILLIGLTFVSIELFVTPHLADETVPLFGKIAAAAYPLADVALLVVLARLAFIRAPRGVSFWMMLSGIAVMLIGDFTFATYAGLGLIGPDILYVTWLVTYVLLGAAALHPSMSQVSEPDVTEHGPGLLRFVLLPGAVALTLLALIPHGARQLLILAATMLAILVTVRIGVLGARAERSWKAERDAEEALRRVAIAEEATREKNAFLSRTSHELRTPLNAILGFGQLLELDPLDDRQAESVDQIMQGGRRLLALVDDVLDTARIENDELVIDPEPVAIRVLADEVVSMLRPMAAAQQVHLSIDGSVGAYAFADRRRSNQILVNLVSNAIKYNRVGGSVRIAWGIEQDSVWIDVADSGPGVTGDLERLFQPFERLGMEASSTPGTGLGLTVARGLAKAQGGSLEIVHTGPLGTVFRLTLPSLADGSPSSDPFRSGDVDLQGASSPKFSWGQMDRGSPGHAAEA